MKRQLISLPIIPDELSINTDKDKIAELLGVSWTQEKSPELFFFHKNSLYKFQAFDWQSETKRYYIWNYGLTDGFKVEDENQEIIELKASSKALFASLAYAEQIAMKERDHALLLEIVAAAHGKKLN